MTQDNGSPQREPSVLDYLKSRLNPWSTQKIEIPPASAAGGADALPPTVQPLAAPAPQPEPSRWTGALPWRALLALLVALIAQHAFEPPHDDLTMTAWAGSFLFWIAIVLAIWALRRSEWVMAAVPSAEATDSDAPVAADQSVRVIPLLVSLLVCSVAFLLFNNNMFTALNLTMGAVGLLCFVWAFWVGGPDLAAGLRRLFDFFTRPEWRLTITRWTLLLLIVAGVSIFYRVYRLDQIPNEPFSDHAEKILDVFDVVSGQTHIFFPRNTGREAIEMYLTAAVAFIFKTGLSFMSLKIGTVILGLLTLPYAYLLGKEVGNRRVGLLTAFMIGIAYWPNVISRIGLRFPLYPVFVAPTLYYLLRGLRTMKRNDFILSGVFLGLGMHGYSPFRFVPVVVVAAILIYALHRQAQGRRLMVFSWLIVLALTAFIVFLPLARYITEDPANSEIFFYRSITRLGSAEQPLPGPIGQVFVSNLWNGIRMLNWDDGQIWVHSVTYRPALDVVSGALFILGAALVLVRYIRERHWLDLFLLISIPLLMMPSILSLAFPDENPALNRAGGAYIPVFLIAALALDGLLTGLRSTLQGRIGTVVAVGVAGLLLTWSMAQNYDLVFNQFYTQYKGGAWNTSEMGAVIQEFGNVYGSTDNTWVVPYPFWVDTRLPGVWAGIPNRDFALWPENFKDTLGVPGPKLVIINAQDQPSVDALRGLYPNSALSLHKSDIEGHDFFILFIPGQ